MLKQQLTKILLCGACLTLFPSHADYPSVELDRYSYQTMPMKPLSNDSLQPVSGTFINKNRDAITKQSWQVRLGLRSAITYLQRNNLNTMVARQGANVTNQTLVNTASSLQHWHGKFTPNALEKHFSLQRLYRGKFNKSKFTGYYTPIISAQLYSDNEYRYPIYRAPKQASKRYLSRAKITAGALANKGLEVAWTNDPLGLFYLHIQGSGIVKLPNGEKRSLKFNGSNDKSFVSIAKHMKKKGMLPSNPSRFAIKQWIDKYPEKMQTIFNINPRFIYFTLHSDNTVTASGTPVITGHTVAVDTNYIPFGAVILAEVPIITTRGQIIGNQWRLLFPQDRGDAIKGPARMDIYTGIGEAARETANSLTGYGRAYLLLNKPQGKQAVTT
ncbi:MAG: MltA domain-containing protein [Cocleimonas sp.]|nr:MltA domain-containing protein [Cocleimonas sp.]